MSSSQNIKFNNAQYTDSDVEAFFMNLGPEDLGLPDNSVNNTHNNTHNNQYYHDNNIHTLSSAPTLDNFPFISMPSVSTTTDSETSKILQFENQIEKQQINHNFYNGDQKNIPNNNNTNINTSTNNIFIPLPTSLESPQIPLPTSLPSPKPSHSLDHLKNIKPIVSNNSDSSTNIDLLNNLHSYVSSNLNNLNILDINPLNINPTAILSNPQIENSNNNNNNLSLNLNVGSNSNSNTIDINNKNHIIPMINNSNNQSIVNHNNNHNNNHNIHNNDSYPAMPNNARLSLKSNDTDLLDIFNSFGDIDLPKPLPSLLPTSNISQFLPQQPSQNNVPFPTELINPGPTIRIENADISISVSDDFTNLSNNELPQKYFSHSHNQNNNNNSNTYQVKRNDSDNSWYSDNSSNSNNNNNNYNNQNYINNPNFNNINNNNNNSNNSNNYYNSNVKPSSTFSSPFGTDDTPYIDRLTPLMNQPTTPTLTVPTNVDNNKIHNQMRLGRQNIHSRSRNHSRSNSANSSRSLSNTSDISSRSELGSLSPYSGIPTSLNDSSDVVSDLDDIDNDDEAFNKKSNNETESANYVCKYCHKAFARPYNLKSHLNTHTDEKPYICKICDKAFARSHDRKRHEKLHSGTKKFQCKGTLNNNNYWGCMKRFARTDALRRHFHTESGQKCINPCVIETIGKGEGEEWITKSVQAAMENALAYIKSQEQKEKNRPR